ncbi:alpha/beta fold hydrolase [Nesterenkonia muleiensis]|uniref:alpha/beta fold hydrolase n=1 Tax=Nesterenkonia muleiensis TaxID=2282648 RepID=UPI000E70F8CB|nr:alpha/beta hydrolase [Nesterenkonia muleiensis]
MATHTVDLHIDDTGGSGRPVVLIHGWPLSAESWAEQTEVLSAAGYRVIAYDRRGFGRSEKPVGGFDYDTLADDLHRVLSSLDLQEVTLVGFSMGGGEVARYVTRHGTGLLHSVVFAAAVPPYLLKSEDNPEGPLDSETFQGLRDGLAQDRESFFEEFTTGFFSAGDQLKVSEDHRQQALRLAHQSDQTAALGCMDAWGTTDFRADLENITVPALVIHGDSDATVPVEGSGQRTHQILGDSELVVIEGAPHGLNVSHASEFNAALLAFLAR